MTEFVSQAAQVGTVPAVPNALASAELDTAILQDPVKIQAFKETIADQLNAQSAGPTFVDLSERIAGIRTETSAQGASILVIALIDPLWVLPMSGFIAVDELGYLWPPIDINLPTGTDCVWRLCQYHATWDQDMSAPNLTLTFEDRIASLLREMSPGVSGGIAQGQPNQTLGGFFKQLVDNANQTLKPRPKIRLVEMISPQDPNYTVPITQLPKSAEGKLRRNPNKLVQGLAEVQSTYVGALDKWLASVFPPDPTPASIQQAEAQAIAQYSVRNDPAFSRGFQDAQALEGP